MTATAARQASDSARMLADIQPFSSTPFDHVPDYLYGNPTQYKNAHWSAERLAQIKKAAGTATKAQIEALAAASFKDTQPSAEALAEKYTEYAETYDGVYALDLLAAFLKDGHKLAVEDIKAVNRRLTRLTLATQGEFRTKYALWPRTHLSATEKLFLNYVTKDAKSLDMFKAIVGAHKAHIPFCETERGLLDSQDQYLRVTDNEYISTESIQELLSIFAQRVYVTHDTHEQLIIDSTLANLWEAEERTSPNYREGYINIQSWIDKRTHHFPAPKDINRLLSNALMLINSCRMHPIEVAARLMWFIGGIHPFNGTHKRTAKILACSVLLPNDFLPPLITAQDAKLYNDTFADSLDEETGGVELFVNLIARLVVRTQEQFKGQTL